MQGEDGGALPVAAVGEDGGLVDVEDAPLAPADLGALPAVRTEDVLEDTLRLMREQADGLIAVNVQEMDLAGHRQDAARWAERLELADRGLGEILHLLNSEDLLLVLGDHSNDPTVGHEFHTREYVPILGAGAALAEPPRQPTAPRDTLADVGATAATVLNLPHEQMELGVPIPELSQTGAARPAPGTTTNNGGTTR